MTVNPCKGRKVHKKLKQKKCNCAKNCGACTRCPMHKCNWKGRWKGAKLKADVPLSGSVALQETQLWKSHQQEFTGEVLLFQLFCSKNEVFSPIELKKKLLEIWRCKEAPGLNPLSNCFLSHDNLGFLLKTREIKTLLVLSILLALEGFEMHHISGSHSQQ